jgi:hypothetical protein
MIKKENRYDSYAYRISDVPASADLIAAGWEEGEFLSFNAQGELVKANGSAPAFMSMSSCRAGRDQFTGKTTRQASILFGALRVCTNSVAAEAFAPGDALYVGADGKLTKTKGSYLVGYACDAIDTEGYLKAMITVPVPVAVA